MSPKKRRERRAAASVQLYALSAHGSPRAVRGRHLVRRDAPQEPSHRATNPHRLRRRDLRLHRRTGRARVREHEGQEGDAARRPPGCCGAACPEGRAPQACASPAGTKAAPPKPGRVVWSQESAPIHPSGDAQDGESPARVQHKSETRETIANAQRATRNALGSGFKALTALSGRGSGAPTLSHSTNDARWVEIVKHALSCNRTQSMHYHGRATRPETDTDARRRAVRGNVRYLRRAIRLDVADYFDYGDELPHMQ